MSSRAVRGKTAKATRFNGKFRDECLRMEIFGNWREAAVVAEHGGSFITRSDRTQVLVIKRRTSSNGIGKSDKDY